MTKTKVFVMALALVALSTGAFAQAQIAIGIKAGPNFATINADDPGTTYKNRTGYHFGAFGLIKLTKIGIQPEILFSQQGTKVKVDGNDFESNFSYINIPIILKLYTIAGINLQAGPQFGFLSKAEIDDDDAKDFVKSSDVSLALGAGWDLPFGLTLDARYNLGLSDINDGISEDKVKNQVWQVSVGYKLIKLGK